MERATSVSTSRNVQVGRLVLGPRAHLLGAFLQPVFSPSPIVNWKNIKVATRPNGLRSLVFDSLPPDPQVQVQLTLDIQWRESFWVTN